MVGIPSKNDFKLFINAGMIKNFPITSRAIEITQEIFGPDIGSLQGKDTKNKGPVINQDMITISRRLKKCAKQIIH